MSLIEVLVASILMLGLLYIMFGFLVPTLRVSAKGEARVEMQQQAVTTLDRIAAMLNASGPSGVSLSDNVYTYVQSTASPRVASMPIVMSIQEIAGVTLDSTNQGMQSWQTFLMVYSWEPDPQHVGQGIVTEKMCPSGTDSVSLMDTEPTGVTDSILTAIGIDTNPALQTRILATGVTDFTVDYDTTQDFLPKPIDITTQSGYPPMPLTIGLSMTRTAATGSRSPELYSLSRTITMRNATQ